MENVKILTEGDTSILIAFKQEISPEVNAKIAATVKLIRQQQTPGIVDVIPTYASLLINYNPQVISYGQLKRRLTALLKMDLDTESSARRVFEIPVCYGGEYGPAVTFKAEIPAFTKLAELGSIPLCGLDLRAGTVYAKAEEADIQTAVMHTGDFRTLRIPKKASLAISDVVKEGGKLLWIRHAFGGTAAVSVSFREQERTQIISIRPGSFGSKASRSVE